MSAFFDALGIVFHLGTLLYILLGVAWGMIFGMIPGLSATLAIVVLIPITYGMEPIVGICMLLGVYIGGVSGGVISAVLLGMPGTPSSITTCYDGYPLAKSGLGEKALGIGAVSNLIGSIVGWIFLILFATQLSRLALKFGPFEYVAIIIFGIIAVVTLSGDSVLKSFLMAVLGLFFATIGSDPTYGTLRNTFGLDIISNGINTIPAMVGMFVIAHICKEVQHHSEKYALPKSKPVKGIMTKEEWKESIPNFLRSSIIGTAIGILPGIGGNLATFVCYDQAKKYDKHPETFGSGNIQGIIASETGNNAVIGGALIPMIALGIPGDTSTAALLGGLQIHDLTPGPLLFKLNPDLVYSVFISFMVAVVFMFVLLMGGKRFFPKILRIKKAFLLPTVLVLSLVGCYNLNYSMKDVWIAVLFGIFGYALSKWNFPMTPIVIGLILGKMLEKNLRLGLSQSGNSLLPLVTQPICIVFLAATVISILFAVKIKKKTIEMEEKS